MHALGYPQDQVDNINSEANQLSEAYSDAVEEQVNEEANKEASAEAEAPVEFLETEITFELPIEDELDITAETADLSAIEPDVSAEEVVEAGFIDEDAIGVESTTAVTEEDVSEEPVAAVEDSCRG